MTGSIAEFQADCGMLEHVAFKRVLQHGVLLACRMSGCQQPDDVLDSLRSSVDIHEASI